MNGTSSPKDTHNKPDWLIVANAHVKLPQSLDFLFKDVTVAVCDGAYAAIQNNHWSIDYLLGDFDSLSNDEREALLSDASTSGVIHLADQNTTDLEKAIVFADEHGAKSITLLNAFGNRIDHSLYNLRLLRAYHNAQRPMYLLNLIYDNAAGLQIPMLEKVRYVIDDKVILATSVGARVAVIGFPQATVTCNDLRWPLDNMQIGFGARDSVSNEATSGAVALTVQGSALVMTTTAL